MTLIALQRDMRDWLGTGSEQCAARFAASAQAGLAVYQNNYRAQLVACLEDSFAVTLAWLGGEAFHAAVVAHVESVPPTSWTLDHYGQDFPITLRRLYPDDAEVGDLAALEWALSEAFVAPDSPPLSVDLTAVDWDATQIGFVPSLSLHTLQSNAPAIWSAINDGSTPPAALLMPAPEALIVWRAHERCHFRSTSTQERDALHALGRVNATFGTLCNALGEREVERVGQWLGQWLVDGIIASLEGNGR